MSGSLPRLRGVASVSRHRPPACVHVLGVGAPHLPLVLVTAGVSQVSPWSHLTRQFNMFLQTAIPGPEHDQHQWPVPGAAPLPLLHAEESLPGERRGQ